MISPFGPNASLESAGRLTHRVCPQMPPMQPFVVLNCAAMDILDIAVRLGVATLVGVLLGLNRDLHGKSTGVRTLGLVCLGSALAVLSSHAATGTEESPGIQGLATGVGFLAPGVILRPPQRRHRHRL